MTCPLCHKRRARRDCPALGQSICSICCGTKRLVEISCPDDCVHLTTARANPAAAVRRQHEADVSLLLPTINGLTERQHQLFFLFHTAIASYRPEGFARLSDGDVAAAAAATAATLETAAKGVIYEHDAGSPIAQTLSSTFMALLERIRKEGATVYDREAAITLRAIEQGARTVQSGTNENDSYLTLIGRLLQVNRPTDLPTPEATQSSIILP